LREALETRADLIEALNNRKNGMLHGATHTYNDLAIYNSYIQNIEDLKIKLKSKEQNKAIEVEKVITTCDQFAFTKELLVDQLFILYLYNDSLSLHNIIEILLNNFTLFMNTIFIRNENFQIRRNHF
jgi:hypothetical protein